jgi:prepilin-type N-terminal cleavage/methylation domain-containing protein
MRRTKTDSKGFTLIEIILALLVITVGITSLIGLFSTTLDTASEAHADLNVVSFSDMIFNYCHSETNWNLIPTSGNLRVPDYKLDIEQIKIGSLSHFTCQTSGSGSVLKNNYTVSYLLDIHASGNLKELNLRIWPGLGTNGTARSFYTELYNWVDK